MNFGEKQRKNEDFAAKDSVIRSENHIYCRSFLENVYFAPKAGRWLSPILHNAKDSKSKEKELYGITNGSHKTAPCQIHTTLYPKPTGWHRVCPTYNADQKAEDSTQRTHNK